MSQQSKSVTGPRWWSAVGAALLAHAIQIAATFAWVAIYSHLIAPGLPVSAYQAHAQVAGPWVALLVGLPLFFWLGRRLARRDASRGLATVVAWLVLYLLTDLALLFAMMPPGAIPWGLVVLLYLAKVVPGLLGARVAGGVPA